MNQLDNQSKQNDYAQTSGTTGQSVFDKLQPKTYEPQKPSMGAKLSKVAEIFELDIINEEEALKACKVIIGQHARSQGKKAESEKEVTIVK